MHFEGISIVIVVSFAHNRCPLMHESATPVQKVLFARRPQHGGLDERVIGTLVMGHSLLRSLVCSHRSLIRLLCTARFARAFRCAHSLAHTLAPELMGKRFMSIN